MRSLEMRLYPQLGAFPAGERPRALSEARNTAFDVIELVGIATGVVLATALTRYGTAELSFLEGIVAAATNFLVAIPLLVVLVGPFLVRRVRRGLDQALQRRRPG